MQYVLLLMWQLKLEKRFVPLWWLEAKIRRQRWRKCNLGMWNRMGTLNNGRAQVPCQSFEISHSRTSSTWSGATKTRNKKLEVSLNRLPKWLYVLILIVFEILDYRELMIAWWPSHRSFRATPKAHRNPLTISCPRFFTSGQSQRQTNEATATPPTIRSWISKYIAIRKRHKQAVRIQTTVCFIAFFLLFVSYQL